MNQRDQKNLDFILSLDSADSIANWVVEQSTDDIVYALELLAAANAALMSDQYEMNELDEWHGETIH
jgi:hypothetical protein